MDNRHILDGLEEEVFLSIVIDVGVYQERISFRMNVLHHHLKSVETSCLWNLDFSHELLSQIFQNNAVRSCKES